MNQFKAKIIITSTWKEDEDDLQKINKALQSIGFKNGYYDVTSTSQSRLKQIFHYLRLFIAAAAEKESKISILILDDMDLFAYTPDIYSSHIAQLLKPFTIQTNGKVGLTRLDVENGINILNLQNNSIKQWNKKIQIILEKKTRRRRRRKKKKKNLLKIHFFLNKNK